MRNFWLAWNEVVRPTLTDTRGEALFISTPKGFNHFYDLYNFQEKDEDYKSFHFTTYDNTHIPKDEIDKAKKELPEDKFSQEYLADFRKTQGLVYKEFDRTKHVYHKKEFNVADTLVGVDWGWTNPSAILKVIKDSDSNYYVTREWYKTGKTTEEIIEVAKSFSGNKYYPDPAEPDRIDLARRLGLNVRDVSKDIEAGISAVQELFKSNRLFIHSSCTNLIWELETYAYPDKKPDHNEAELPIKENDHAVDTLRYVLYMQQPVGISNQAKQYIPNHNMARRGYQMPNGYN
jgi:PBSX family phage terminase large subunit